MTTWTDSEMHYHAAIKVPTHQRTESPKQPRTQHIEDQLFQKPVVKLTTQGKNLSKIPTQGQAPKLIFHRKWKEGEKKGRGRKKSFKKFEDR